MEGYQVIRLTEVFIRTLEAMGAIVAQQHRTMHVLGQRVDEMGSVSKELAHIREQLALVIEGEGIITAADDRIEADVAIINTQTAAVAAAFATLKGEIEAGGAPSSQTLADLDTAVGNLTSTVSPPAAPPADGGDTPPADGGDVPPADGGDTPPADDGGATGAGDPAPVTSP